MTGDERRITMLLYAADMLDAAEAEAIRRLLDAGSPEHLADLAEARATLAHLPLLLAEQKPSHEADTRLMERVRRTVPPTLRLAGDGEAAESLREAAPVGGVPRSRPLPWLWALGGAVAAGMVAVVATWGVMSLRLDQSHRAIATLQAALGDQVDEVQRLQTRLVSQGSRVRELEQETGRSRLLVQSLEGRVEQQGVQLASLTMQAGEARTALADVEATLVKARDELGSARTQLAATQREAEQAAEAVAVATRKSELLDERGLRVASLAGTDALPDAWGRVLWDPQTRRGGLFAGNLTPLPPGREYQFWYVTESGQKVSGGTFTLGAGGEAFLPLTAPDALAQDDPAKLYAITREPAGGSPQPTGDILVAGEAG